MKIEMGTSQSEVTELLRLVELGAPDARQRLFDLLYSDLRRLAAHRMRRERNTHTLTATALVHEAYLRLAGAEMAGCQNRGHFLALASQAMRRILVDHARSRLASKRGGQQGISIPADSIPAPGSLGHEEELVALDEAMTALHAMCPRKCRVVELRFFAGLTEEQAAETLGVSRRTVNRDWEFARAWLLAHMRPQRGRL